MTQSSDDATAAILARRFDLWTQNLLDLSKRNRLLYFRPQPNTTVKLVEPDLHGVWNRLVKRGKVQSFYGLEAEADVFEADEEEGDLDIAPQRALRTDELRTDLASTRLGKTLFYLRHRAKTSLEEQGVATLFVAFGLLKWNEAGKGGKAGDDIFSPLLLVPVSLQRESARKPYTLKLWEEEAVLNPALKFRLAAEARIELPEPDDEADDLDLAAYFAQVENAIAAQRDWMLQETAYLALFSFHKIAMYRDLCDHRERALSHSLVRALAGDRAAVPLAPADLPQGAMLDTVAPREAWQVVDADSSQQEAIEAARRGVSFVLQGPPGTGKSQTITNIIAECLAAGKKVLFVSEKMAALQVVHSRLEQSGLRDFCLEAHSHKANKREVVAELDRTLRAARPTFVSSGNEADQLMQLRDGLNGYVRSLHTPRLPSGASVYAASGDFCARQEAPQLMFSFDEPLQVSPAQRTQISDCLREMARLSRVLAAHETHPWRGVAVSQSDLQTREEIGARFSRLASSLRDLDASLRATLDSLGLKLFPSAHATTRVLALAETLLQSPLPPRTWLEETDLSRRRQRASEWQPRFEAFNARRESLIADCRLDFLSLPHAELLQRLTTHHESVLRRVLLVSPDARTLLEIGEAALNSREELMSGLSQTVSLIEASRKTSRALSDTLQTKTEETLSQAVWLSALADFVARDPRPQPHWFEAGQIEEMEEAARAAQSNENAIAAARQTLAPYDIDKLLALDLDNFIARFAGSYLEAEHLVATELQSELEKLSSFSLEGETPNYHQALADLKIGGEAWRQNQWFQSRADELSRMFRGYNGVQTDWPQAREEAVAAAQEASEQQAAFVAAREKLAANYNVETLLALDHRALRETIEKHATSFWRFLNPSFNGAVKAVQETRTSAAAMAFAETSRDLELAEAAAQHRSWLQSNASTRAASDALFQGLETDWNAVKNHIAATADEAQARAAIYRNAAEHLHGYNIAALLREDLPALHERLVNRYGEAVRIIEEDLARDVATLQGARWAPETLALSSWLRDLQTAHDLRERENRREMSLASHAHHFGRHFNGARTDWTSVLSALQTCREIAAHHGDKNFVALQEVLCAGGENIAQATAQNAQLKTVLGALQSAMKLLHAVFPLRDFPFTDRLLAHASLPDLRDFLFACNASLADFFAAYDASGARDGASLSQRQTDLKEGAAVSQERSALEVFEDEGRTLFDHFFDGTQTNWKNIETALDWSARVLAWFGTNAIPEQTLAAATDANARDALRVLAENLRARCEAIGDDWDFAGRIFPQWQIGGRPCDFASLTDCAAWLEERGARLDELEEWLAWQRLEAASTRAGLSGFWECALREKPEAAHLEGAFWRRFWALWLDRARHAAPELAHFAGGAHDDNIERFRFLDTASLKSAQTRLAATLAQGRPSAGMARAGEVAVLQKEAVKKARHKPLRQLFAEIPNVLQALKPCLLMSPLSVAQFLQPDKVRFDLVIFDEASQICSEDAVGAIMRGAQLIVVGDRKQLPPSRFFGGSLEEDDEESEAEGGEVYESILDECATMGLPDRMLRWHYRSRNEELIAFSNQHFYESSLVTFPGPHPIGTDVRGVSFEKVGGTYIRGKAKDARTNPIEARRVAELALEHFEKTPGESLGVIAFNEAQMRAILGEVHRLAAARPHLDAFLNADGPDAFFVKNLENVQGDERDVILFSIGYGPDQNGTFSMNFGPLNRPGGERRLNVAVTRAKLRVHIVASFEPEDIKQERVSRQGPKLLAQYLAFAKNGGIWNGGSGAAAADALQESVARVLAARGWKVQRQVGFSELRIDLAVQDPNDADNFLLGIECDGASYVSAKTARDRDRLRDQVLRGLGWQLLRLWTPDWIANQDSEIARIERALEEAQVAKRLAAQVAAPVAPISTVAPPDYGTQVLAPAATQMPPTVVLPTTPSATPITPTVALHNTVALAANPASSPPVSSAAQTRVLAAPVSPSLPVGAVWHSESALPHQGAPDAFYTLAKNRPSGIVLALARVVEDEGPIHITAATRRVVAAWGMNRAGGKLLAIIEDAARRAQGRNLLQQRGEFLWPPNIQNPLVRVPQINAAPRAVEEIAIEEIAEAAFLCVRDCFALSREELLHQTARLLGFKQTGANVRARIEEALRVLASDKRVECESDTFTVA